MKIRLDTIQLANYRNKDCFVVEFVINGKSYYSLTEAGVNFIRNQNLTKFANSLSIINKDYTSMWSWFIKYGDTSIIFDRSSTSLRSTYKQEIPYAIENSKILTTFMCYIKDNFYIDLEIREHYL